MTEGELARILEEGESDRVEFTVSVNDNDKFSEAICAFANDLPNHGRAGYLVVGVDDRGRATGIDVDDALLLKLGNFRDNGAIQPLPTLTVEKVSTEHGDVAVVTVAPSQLPPVRYKGRVCIRTGPRRGYATEMDERILTERRVSFALTFDAEPALGTTLDDLALPIFQLEYQPQAIDREVIAENHRSMEQQLASLRFFDLRNCVPTHAGLVLFAKDVRARLSGAYIQFLRVDGVSLADDVLQDREIGGDLLTLLRELQAVLDAHLNMAPSRTSSLRETMVAEYPEVAVREILLNAVMHRSYASTAPVRFTWFNDRIEIQSPGGLYGEASQENFPNQTSYRNPVIAEALKALGYVNRYGRGVIRARDAMARNGNPAIEFGFYASYVLAILRKAA